MTETCFIGLSFSLFLSSSFSSLSVSLPLPLFPCLLTPFLLHRDVKPENILLDERGSPLFLSLLLFPFFSLTPFSLLSPSLLSPSLLSL